MNKQSRNNAVFAFRRRTIVWFLLVRQKIKPSDPACARCRVISHKQGMNKIMTAFIICEHVNSF